MGSFHATCAISHMTLYRQRTSIQLLIPMYGDDDISLAEHKNLICSNEGAQTLYSPFGFPIHGRYDDYGRIDEIERDKGVEDLEKFFGIRIEEIIAKINRAKDGEIEGIKNGDTYLKLGMAFYRTEVLEHLQRGWDEVDLTNPDRYTSAQRLKKFLEAAQKEPANLEEQRMAIMEKRKAKQQLTEDELEILFTNSDSKHQHSYIPFRSNSFLAKLDIDFSAQQSDIIKQWMFLRRMGEMDRILMPSSYGGQDINHAEIYLLNEIVQDLLVEDLEDYYDDWGEDAPDDVALILRSHGRGKKFRELGI